MEIKIDLENAQQIQGLLEKFPDIMGRNLELAMLQSTLLLQREVAARTPTGAHQLLRKSIISNVERLPLGLIGVVGTSIGYAEPVELGTKPHFPPIAPLIDWAIAKLGVEKDHAESVAHAIAWKIYHRGTEGAFMFKNAFEANQDFIQGLFRQAVADTLAQIGGGTA